MENKSTIFGPPERALRRIPYFPCSKSRCPDPSASLYVSHCQIRSLPTLSSRTAGPSTQEERSTVRSAVTRPRRASPTPRQLKRGGAEEGADNAQGETPLMHTSFSLGSTRGV